MQPWHVLFGHTARLWDICFLPAGGRGMRCDAPGSLVVSAAEDCTCRVWDVAGGGHLASIRGHRGRGVWRCAPLTVGGSGRGCNSSSGVGSLPTHLVTGGADGGVKVWRLADWLQQQAAVTAAAAAVASQGDGVVVESFALAGVLPGPGVVAAGQSWTVVPWLPQQEQKKPQAAAAPPPAPPRFDSKGEWVRLLALAGQHCLLVATNRGLLHQVLLPEHEQGAVEAWCTLHVPDSTYPASPVTWCTVLAGGGDEASGSGDRGARDLLVGMCTHAGSAVVVRAGCGGRGASDGCAGPASCSWRPYDGRATFAVFPCAAQGSGDCLCFTAGSDGLLTLWRLPRGAFAAGGEVPLRLAEAQSPCRDRLMALDCVALPPSARPTSVAEQLLLVVAGDTQGSVVAWLLHLPADAGIPSAAAGGGAARPGSGASLRLLAATKRVHEVTPVRWLCIRPLVRAAIVASAAVRAAAADSTIGAAQVGDGGSEPAVLPAGAADADICSAGGDGSICRLRLVERGPPMRVPPQQQLQAAQPVASPAALIVVGRELLPCITMVDGDGHFPGPGVGSVSGGGSSSSSPEGGSSLRGSDGDERVVWGFQASELVAWSATHDAEIARVWRPSRDSTLCRAAACSSRPCLLAGMMRPSPLPVAQVPCGGWRRPAAAAVAGGDVLTFAYQQDAEIRVHRRRRLVSNSRSTESSSGGDSGSGQVPAAAGDLPPRGLHAAHHGLETDCVCLLPTPTGGSGTPALLTAGEEGSVRLLLPPDGGTTGSACAGVFGGSALLGQHAAGTVVKALALAPLDPLHWLLVSAGARQVLMAWRLRWQPPPRAGAGGLRLECCVLGTRPPPGRGLRPKPLAEVGGWVSGRGRGCAASAVALP